MTRDREKVMIDILADGSFVGTVYDAEPDEFQNEALSMLIGWSSFTCS